MTWLIDLILGPLGAVLGGMIALAVAYIKGRSGGKRDAEIDRKEKELEAHDRINRAETGAGLSDRERRERLRRLEGDWRNGS